jgi:glucosylceramidase
MTRDRSPLIAAAVMMIALAGCVSSGSTASTSATASTPAASTPATSASTVRVDGTTAYQAIDGFGFAEAFQRSAIMHGSLGLSPANQRNVLDLLFSQTKGAGFSILRLGIGSSADDGFDHMRSIEPVSPGSPAAAPRWAWDGSDNGQVWLARQALSYGVKRIYADAWSAPGYMKSNGRDSSGGYLCGGPGMTCRSGDWRQAYASELAQYIQFYARSGVPITDVGFLNEPELSTPYASMQSDGALAAGFIPILARALRADHLHTQIVCCDNAGWDTGTQDIQQILQVPAAARYLAVASAHGYQAPPAEPLTAQRPAWETEWSVFDAWDPAWDDGSDASGMTWAQNVMTALTSANVSAFLYWWGAAEKTGNEQLILLKSNSYQTSGRLWALAAFSRFIRPGAVRIAAGGGGTGLLSAAFRNSDGSVVVELINTGSRAKDALISLRGTPAVRSATAYITDTGSHLAAAPSVPVRGGQVSVSAPPRSLVTVVLASS